MGSGRQGRATGTRAPAVHAWRGGLQPTPYSLTVLLILISKNTTEVLLLDWNDQEVDVGQQQRQHDHGPDFVARSGDAEIDQRQPNIHRIASESIRARYHKGRGRL